MNASNNDYWVAANLVLSSDPKTAGKLIQKYGLRQRRLAAARENAEKDEAAEEAEEADESAGEEDATMEQQLKAVLHSWKPVYRKQAALLDTGVIHVHNETYPVVVITCVQYLGPPGPFSFPDSRDLLEVLRRTSLAEREPPGRIP